MGRGMVKEILSKNNITVEEYVEKVKEIKVEWNEKENRYKVWIKYKTPTH